MSPDYPLRKDELTPDYPDTGLPPVHRLRPKLLTEGAAILSIAPMLWATGVGAEVIRPMAAPVLGGLLVADEVIDVFLPVLYFAVHKVRWSKLVHSHPHRASTMVHGQVPASLG